MLFDEKHLYPLAIEMSKFKLKKITILRQKWSQMMHNKPDLKIQYGCLVGKNYVAYKTAEEIKMHLQIN